MITINGVEMSGLRNFLESLALAAYTPIFAEKGYEDVSQLTGLTSAQLDQLFASVGMLKGHALKLRKSVETFKSSEPVVLKKAKLSDQQSSPPRADSKPVVSAVKPAGTLPQPGTIKIKEAERLAAKLADTESIREDYRRAKNLVLGIDIAKFRKVLDEVVVVQDALAKAWVIDNEGEDH